MTNPCLYYSLCGAEEGGQHGLLSYLFFMRADLFILTVEKHVSSHSIPRADGQMHFQCVRD